MSRGMSRGGGGFPIIIAVLGVLILAVIGIFIWMQVGGDRNNDNTSLDNNPIVTMAPTEAPTEIPTVAPTVAPTVEVTVAPTVEVTAAPTVEATQYVTAVPVYNTDRVWINVEAIRIRTQANFDSEQVGKIPYATEITGDVSGKWMKVTYDGVAGYIYLGKTSMGKDDEGETIWRQCVVYSSGELQDLPEDVYEDEDLIESITATRDGGYLKVEIKFTEKVYGKDNGTGDIAESCFAVTNGDITDYPGGDSGTTYISFTINLADESAAVKVTVRGDCIFNAEGIAAATEEETFS